MKPASPRLKGEGLVCEDFMIPGPDPGIELFVRNKRPSGLTDFSPENVVLFVHGATYPADRSFDFPAGGISWMEYIAERGFDVYLVNIRGYGQSTRPPEMSAPADQNPPVVHTSTAMADYTAAAHFVMQRRAIPSLNVMGWSWGTAICGLYASLNPDKVNRLVLHAPVWLRNTSALIDSGRTLGAYRKVTADDAKRRWATGIPAGKRTVPSAWQEEWISAILASDPVGQKADPPYIRAPNGVVQDSRDYWASGKPGYQPADIRVPTLLILGEWDADTPVYMAQALFSALGNASEKRLVVIGESTHMLMLEENRMQLFEEVQLFLDAG